MNLRTNYKFVNGYVCGQNKCYPSSENIFDDKAIEIYSLNETYEQDMPEDSNTTRKINDFKMPQFYNKVKVRISFSVKFSPSDKEKLPQVATSILSGTDQRQLLLTDKDIKEFISPDPKGDDWSIFSNEDLFPMRGFPDPKGHIFRIEFWNHYKTKMKIKNLTIKFLGIE